MNWLKDIGRSVEPAIDMFHVEVNKAALDRTDVEDEVPSYIGHPLAASEGGPDMILYEYRMPKGSQVTAGYDKVFFISQRYDTLERFLDKESVYQYINTSGVATRRGEIVYVGKKITVQQFDIMCSYLERARRENYAIAGRLTI